MGICLERMRYKYRGFRIKFSFSPRILDQLLLKRKHHPPILRKSFMSISPTHLQRSESFSSSTALPHNPTSFDDGHLLQPSSNLLVGSPTSNSEATQTFQSLQISGGSNSPSNRTPVSMDADTADSGRPTKKMSEGRTSYGRRNSNRQHHGNYPQHRPAGRGQGGISSQFRHHQVAEETSAVTSSQQQPSNSNSAARRSNTTNANHLLNFHYDRVSRPQPRAPPPRRQQKKIKPYNKDLFLQANFKFVVLDSGNSAMESTDPDKMLQWENVIFVKYSTPFPVQCPICLESPFCPQITSCGHIFCFPCILQHLLMGVEDHKGECWKKCPLCFMMISSKDLYTIYIENVSHYCVGDTIQFTLLTREKNSLFPSEKNQGLDSMADGSVDFCDSFSKFISTSDVELSVREACSELKDWLARADSGLVDNLEQLPYVCTALEQLEQRKKFWAEIQLSCSPPSRSPTTHLSMKGHKYSAKTEPHTFSSNLKGVVDSEVYEPNNVTQTGNPCEGEEKVLSSSCDEEKVLRRVSNDSQHMKENDSYSFYQVVDGQHLILHPLNMKCLLHYYGSYDLLPHRISGEILQLETVTQSEAIRRRYRYLSHFSLTTTFQLCEIDMTKILPPDALAPFIDEIKKRENQRKRLAKKEHLEKVKAEAAAMHAMPIPFNFGPSSFTENTFSMDDFEALGSTPLPSTSPPAANERTTFSSVTRLGFAAAYDSPSLKVDDSASAASSNTEDRGETSSVAGQRNMVTLSFSDIMSTPKSSESVNVPKMNAIGGKKGKKPTRVLLSTAGGRRY